MAKILIIEDDFYLSRMYQQAFSKDKLQVEIASDGQQGLEKAKNKPDIILLDIMMAKFNGLEVLSKLKNDPDTQKIPVIILTNLADEKFSEQAISLGAVKYIIKSDYKPSQVTEMVKEILKATTRNDIH